MDVFFDTAVVIYASLDDPERSPIAQQLLEAGGTISAQVLNEYVAVMRRKYAISWERVREGLTRIQELCSECVPLTAEINNSAVELAVRYNFYIYDALIVASALDAGCSTLYTEDLQDGQRIGELTVRNPFRRRN